MKKNAFFIHPVRGISDDYLEQIENIRTDLEKSYNVYDPSRDTNQDDQTGLNICKENKHGIVTTDVVFVAWDGKSTGCLFDLGMAFALGKRVIPITGYFPLLTNQPPGKSFVRMIWAWEHETGKYK